MAKRTNGTGGNDTLSGTMTGIFHNADEIFGFAGDDTIDGRGGRDTLFGGSGNDTLLGGNGNDTLMGEGDDDTLDGGDGDDHLDGGEGTDILSGGRGNDHIDGGSSNSDYDWVSYDYADRGVIVDLSIGTAYVANNDQDTLLNIENVIGSAFNDDIVGTDGVNTIIGGAGFDDLAGRGGDDVFIKAGNAGEDNIDGGTGVDTVDYLGMTGLFGQIESDVEGVAVNLGAGVATWSVVLNSNVYIDTLQSIENAIGTAYDDQLLGSDVANRLEGRGGSDEIRGFGGADTLEGGGGNDTIHGGTGGDTIIGGRGSDVLYGEAGGDTFVFRNGDGFDRIADFEQGQDLIDFSAMGLTFADISISTSKGFVSISAEDVSITVMGAAASQFDASDFVF